jgi:hypothetical protein
VTPLIFVDPLGLCAAGTICVTSWGTPWPTSTFGADIGSFNINSEAQIYARGNSGDRILWGYDVNMFVNGVLHGVRQPGENRGACILRNANETTGGQHDKLLAAAAWGAYSASALLTQVSAPQMGTMPFSPQSPSTWTVLAQTAITVFRAVGTVAPAAAPVAARGAYYLGNGIVWGGTALAGAEAGLLIGSAINCR